MKYNCVEILVFVTYLIVVDLSVAVNSYMSLKLFDKMVSKIRLSRPIVSIIISSKFNFLKTVHIITNVILYMV